MHPALIPTATLARPLTPCTVRTLATPLLQRGVSMQTRGAFRGRGRGLGRGRGRGRGGASRGRARFKPARGGYKGAGIALTPVEKGYRYFKPSFVENPWMALEREFAKVCVNQEEISIDSDDGEAAGADAADGPAPEAVRVASGDGDDTMTDGEQKKDVPL